MAIVGVTGASGLVGRSLVRHLHKAGTEVVALSRSRPQCTVASNLWRPLPDLATGTSYTEQLEEVDILVHCAARVHIMQDTSPDSLAAFRAVNRDGSIALAKAALDRGVKQFIFLSTVKVNGEASAPGAPIHPDDTPNPSDPYAISKYEAELALRELFKGSGTALAVIRPVLTYGPGVGANFAALANLANRGIPFPFAMTENKRSLLYVGNLVDLIARLTRGDVRDRDVYIPSDPEAVSTSELIEHLAVAQGSRAFHAPIIPMSVWRTAARLMGKGALARRLLESLETDRSHLEQAGWEAPFTLAQGLTRTFGTPTL